MSTGCFYYISFFDQISYYTQCTCILQIVRGGKSFAVFVDWSVTTKLFQWNSLCNRPCPCKATVQLQKFSSELQFSSATTILFHLKQFVIYGKMHAIPLKNHVMLTWSLLQPLSIARACTLSFKFMQATAHC